MRKAGVYYSNQKLVERSEKMETPNCDHMKKLYNTHQSRYP